MSAFWHRWSFLFKPHPRLVAFSERLARYAHMDWVVLFFFFLYFFDSFLIFVPAEGILSVTLLLAPDRQRPWVLAAATGALCGFALFYFLSISSFQPWVIELIHQNDLSDTFDTLVSKTSEHGYLKLGFAVSTFIPPVACLIAGILVGLNPFFVLVIVLASKVVRIYAMIYLMRYLKISMLGLRRRLHDRREHKVAAHDHFEA